MTKDEISKSLHRWRRLLSKAQLAGDVSSWCIYLFNYTRDLENYANCLHNKDGD